MIGGYNKYTGKGGRFGPFTDYLNSSDKCREVVSTILAIITLWTMKIKEACFLEGLHYKLQLTVNRC